MPPCSQETASSLRETGWLMPRWESSWISPACRWGYSVITISEADCKVKGGQIIGDVRTHLGSTGEWGHGISILTGGDGARVEDVKVHECWGDGIYVGGGVDDVVLTRCDCRINRRNGASVTGASGVKFEGGCYNSNGTVNGTAPKGGIYFEPNPNVGTDVVEFSVNGVDCNYNAGAGIGLIRAETHTTRGKVSNSTCAGNAGPGILGAGALGSMMVDLTGMTLSYNLHGVQAAALGLNFAGGHFYSNSQNGVTATAKVKLKGVTVDYNGRTGVAFADGASNSALIGSEVSNNATSATATYPEVDIAADTCHVVGSVVLPATGGNRASWGVVVRSTASKAKLNAVTITSGTAGFISAQTDTVQTAVIKS